MDITEFLRARIAELPFDGPGEPERISKEMLLDIADEVDRDTARDIHWAMVHAYVGHPDYCEEWAL